MINKKAIAHSFSRAAKNYDKFAKFQQEIGQYLFKSLSYFPGSLILDAGCGTGHFSKKWKLIGKKVIALDLSYSMLSVAKQKKTATNYIVADIELLPFQNETIDFCFSNLAIQWCNDMNTALSELYRVTKKGGSIVFSTLSDGSLRELEESWKKIDNKPHINSFLTFDEVKKKCIKWEHKLKKKSWKLNYSSFSCLLNSLKGIGASYLLTGRKPGLMTKSYITKLIDNYPTDKKNLFPLTYELIFGKLYKK